MLVHARACGASIVRGCVRARACGRRRLPSPLALRRACHGSHARRSLVGSSGDGRQARLWAAVLPAAGSVLGRPVVARARKACCPVGRLLVGDGMPLSKAAASSATSHSHEGHRVKADVGRVHRVCHRPVRRADRGWPRACIDDQSSDREGARTRQPEGASQRATEDRRLVSRRACVFAPTRRGKAPARGPPERARRNAFTCYKGSRVESRVVRGRV